MRKSAWFSRLFGTEGVLSVPTYVKKYNAQIKVTLFEASLRRLS